MNTKRLGEERRGAGSSCILALSLTNYNQGSIGLLVGQGAYLQDGNSPMFHGEHAHHGWESLLLMTMEVPSA